MKFKQPEFLNVEIKNARGLAEFQDIYALRLNTFAAGTILDTMTVIAPLATGETSLRPGEETAIVVPLPELPLNANVTKITGSLQIEENTTGGEPPQTKVVVEEVDVITATYYLDVETPIRPRNIELRLEQGDVFWTSTGMPPKDSYALPDFAEQVNAYLDKVKPENNQINLRFLVKSDISGTAEIKIYAREYSQLQTQIWENPLDETVRFDRNFQLKFSAVERIPLESIADVNRNVSLKHIRLDVGGELGQERLLGSVEEYDVKEFATISNDYSVAQKFELEPPIQCVGMSGFFQTGREAEVYIEIQQDMNGFPATGSPLTKANLSLTLPEKNGAADWSFVNFETPVDLRADTPYWIVMKGVQGHVQLGLQVQQEDQEQQEGYRQQQLLVNRGGQLWKSIDPAFDLGIIVGLLRLVYLPEIDNQTAAVEIGIEEAQLYQHLDPKPQAQTISFDVEEKNLEKVSIIIKSHAQGTLSIANVIQEYSSG